MSPKHFTMATIVLFSASGQTHCTLALCNSKWVTVILHSMFWISTEVVTTLFSCGHWHGWCHMKLLLSQHTFNVHHTSRHLQCHFIQSYVHRMHVCLVATCHLHIWQNDQDLFYAIAVTQGWNGYRNKSPAQKADLGEEKPKTFRPWVWHSITELSCSQLRTDNNHHPSDTHWPHLFVMFGSLCVIVNTKEKIQCGSHWH